MILTLQRRPQQPHSTPGSLAVNGVFECFSLELPVRDGLPGSAIPAGRYPVVLKPSPKFLAVVDPWVQNYASAMPHVEPIPNRSLIMIHFGNAPTDTNGCILVGQNRSVDFVGNSRSAFAALYIKIARAVAQEGCEIEILDCSNNHDNVQ